MELRYVDLDARLDAVQKRFFDSDDALRAQWTELEGSAWLYHELQLEGVPVRPSDIRRARAGEDGADYCDRVLLEQIRRADRVLTRVRDDAERGVAPSISQMRNWAAQLTEDEADVVFRKKDGPTEHYKHDVVAPDDIIPHLEALFEKYSEGSQDAHPLRIGLELLYGIGKAWPFTQWSGMCARLAASSVLISNGYPQLIIPTKERMSYYQAYHYDPSRMTELFLNCVDGVLAMKDGFLDGRHEIPELYPEDTESG